MILLGDLGGTNARLALAEPGTTDPVSEWRVATADFSESTNKKAPHAGPFALSGDAQKFGVSTAAGGGGGDSRAPEAA